MLYINYTSIKKDFFNCLLLSMAFKLPEGSPPSNIKKLNSTIFTASHKQSTILSISSTVSCVFKSGKRFYRFLGVSAINVNLQEKKHGILPDGSQLVVNINYKKKNKCNVIFTLEEAVTA